MDVLDDGVAVWLELRVWHKAKSSSEVEKMMQLRVLETKSSPRGINESYCRFAIADEVVYKDEDMLTRVQRIMEGNQLSSDIKNGDATGWIIVRFGSIPPSIVIGDRALSGVAGYGLGVEFRIP